MVLLTVERKTCLLFYLVLDGPQRRTVGFYLLVYFNEPSLKKGRVAQLFKFLSRFEIWPTSHGRNRKLVLSGTFWPVGRIIAGHHGKVEELLKPLVGPWECCQDMARKQPYLTQRKVMMTPKLLTHPTATICSHRPAFFCKHHHRHQSSFGRTKRPKLPESCL